MSHVSDHDQHTTDPGQSPEKAAPQEEKKPSEAKLEAPKEETTRPLQQGTPPQEGPSETGPVERTKGTARTGLRGTAAMDPKTRQEVARKGGLAVSRNKAHMAEIGRKGGQSVSRNREHMAQIGRKGGAASRGHR